MTPSMSSSSDALRVLFETYSKIGGSLTGMIVSCARGREEYQEIQRGKEEEAR